MSRLKIIKALAGGSRDYWQLLAECDISGLEFASELKKMNGKDVEFKRGKFSLKDRKKWILLLKKDFSKEKRAFSRIAKQRPAPTDEYYQDFLGTDDIFKRIKLMRELCDVQGKNVAVLGDDDLFSIALGLAGTAGSIHALEIDERIVETINRNAKKMRLNVHAEMYNIAEPLPARLRNKYGLVVTEPVETIEGIKIWLSRCAGLLKKGGVLYFGLTLLESPFSKWIKIEKMLVSMGFAITDIKRNFSFYPPHKCIDDSKTRIARISGFSAPKNATKWYRSWLIRCEAVSTPKPIVNGKKKISRSFYYDKYFLG